MVIKVLKERIARIIRRDAAAPLAVWQRRFYDFNVWSERKRIEKLKYIHRNPVKRGLVSEADQWEWSSFRSYAYGEPGRVRINFQEWPLEIKLLKCQTFSGM